MSHPAVKPPALTIAISSRALFDLNAGNEIWENQGSEAFDRHQIENEDKPLAPGPAFHLVRKLLALNPPGEQLIQVVLLSRNSPAAGVRVMKSIQHHGLPIEKAVFTNGGSRFRYVSSLGVDLFLCREPEDAKKALDAGIAAAAMMDAPEGSGAHEDLRIAFDGDAVLFSDESERVYKSGGLAAFHAHERQRAGQPLGEGPFFKVLEALHRIRAENPEAKKMMRIALVTARGVAAHERVLKTLRTWGLSVDEAHFVAGLDKGRFLRAFGADMFFDDQVKHVDMASEFVPSGHVPSGVANETHPTGEEGEETQSPARRFRR